MTPGENKALVRRLYEAINQRDFDVFDEVLAPEYVHRSSGEYQVNREQFKEMTINLGLAAAPDLHATIDEMIAEDDKVMVRWTQRGTHLGPFLDIPPPASRSATLGLISSGLRMDRLSKTRPTGTSTSSSSN